MRPLGIFIGLSLAAHAALVAFLLLWNPAFFGASGGGAGGAGEIVSVWIAGADGVAIGPPAVKKPTRTPSPATRPQSRNEPPPSATGLSGIPGGSGDGVGTGSGGGLGSDGDGDGDPRLAEIWRKINRSKYYPEVAKRAGVEGAPRVSFSISDDGRVSQVALVTSCGQAILDEAAKETIRRAAPLPAYPAPITLAVKYSLTK